MSTRQVVIMDYLYNHEFLASWIVALGTIISVLSFISAIIMFIIKQSENKKTKLHSTVVELDEILQEQQYLAQNHVFSFYVYKSIVKKLYKNVNTFNNISTGSKKQYSGANLNGKNTFNKDNMDFLLNRIREENQNLNKPEYITTYESNKRKISKNITYEISKHPFLCIPLRLYLITLQQLEKSCNNMIELKSYNDLLDDLTKFYNNKNNKNPNLHKNNFYFYENIKAYIYESLLLNSESYFETMELLNKIYKYIRSALCAYSNNDLHYKKKKWKARKIMFNPYEKPEKIFTDLLFVTPNEISKYYLIEE